MELEDYYVQKVGSGDPLRFFPGAGFGGLEGLILAERLADQYETHLIDLPGMGRSKGFDHRVKTKDIADWVKRYIDQNGLEKVSVMGHSMGGYIALVFAYHYPEQTERVVLLDHGHKPMPFITPEFGLFTLAIPLLNGLERFLGAKLHRRLDKSFGSEEGEKEERTEADLTKGVEMFCKRMCVEDSPYVRKALQEDLPNDASSWAFMLCFSRTHFPTLLHNLTVPTLLVYGTYAGFDEKEAKRTHKWMARIPAARTNIQTYPVDTKHYVHWAGAEPLNQIERFMTGSLPKIKKVNT